MLKSKWLIFYWLFRYQYNVFRMCLLIYNCGLCNQVSASSRALPEVSLDGRNPFFLDRNEYLEVRMSKYPLPTVDRLEATSDWVQNLNDLLKWNQNFASRYQASYHNDTSSDLSHEPSTNEIE